MFSILSVYKGRCPRHTHPDHSVLSISPQKCLKSFNPTLPFHSLSLFYHPTVIAGRFQFPVPLFTILIFLTLSRYKADRKFCRTCRSCPNVNLSRLKYEILALPPHRELYLITEFSSTIKIYVCRAESSS